MKKAYFLLTILIGLAITLAIGRAILQNTLSTSGIFVSEAEKEISLYKTQNAILSEKLLAASSLTNILEKARKIGFTDEKSLMVIKTSGSLAVRP
jgi:cell division protein FtsL